VSNVRLCKNRSAAQQPAHGRCWHQYDTGGAGRRYHNSTTHVSHCCGVMVHIATMALRNEGTTTLLRGYVLRAGLVLNGLLHHPQAGGRDVRPSALRELQLTARGCRLRLAPRPRRLLRVHASATWGGVAPRLPPIFAATLRLRLPALAAAAAAVACCAAADCLLVTAADVMQRGRRERQLTDSTDTAIKRHVHRPHPCLYTPAHACGSGVSAARAPHGTRVHAVQN